MRLKLLDLKLATAVKLRFKKNLVLFWQVRGVGRAVGFILLQKR
jgi:hypothetical protein